ncbi:hypothetical protein ACGFZB_38205 [Streptomyces cinerochromogenes]|uniref:Fungal lipase-type domain-containing protein n=1 Tax=Streptomyces cinerochromogenes TaxID=66422 RepID=A0ABW7BJT2_9ACTN
MPWVSARFDATEGVSPLSCLLRDPQAYIPAGDDVIITAFRGMEAAQIKDRLSDATTAPCPGPAGTGRAHHGFAEALNSICPQAKDTLADLRANGQKAFFTGHSLAGALAMGARARMYLEEPRPTADSACAYGQPAPHP